MKTAVLFILLGIISSHVYAGCTEFIPNEVRLDKLRSATDYVIHNYEMTPLYHQARNGGDSKGFETFFKSHVTKFQSLVGAKFRLKKKSGEMIEKDIYRSSILSWKPDAIHELIDERKVQTIIHLSNSSIFPQGPWIDAEKDHFLGMGGKTYQQISDFDYRKYKSSNLEEGFLKVRDIISMIVEAEGNVLIHCLGGTHRTEIIFEVMQKCINQEPLESIMARHKCLCDWQSKEKTGTFEAMVMEFVEKFPCQYLNVKQ